MELYQKVREAAIFLQKKINKIPDFAIVAGTGLSSLSEEVEEAFELKYADIPHFPKPSVEGHDGKMIFGKISGKDVVVLRGRFHYYEGFNMSEVTFYVRVLSMLGIEQMIISNASGALQENIEAGDIVFVEDHINMQPENPLRGISDSRLGLRFPPMDKIYDKKMLGLAEDIARHENYRYHSGVYVGLQGPSLETPAEYHFYGKMGGHVVGMSTVPEVIVAAQCQMKVLCISLCTNNPFVGEAATSIKEVMAVAEIAGGKIRKVIRVFLERI